MADEFSPLNRIGHFYDQSVEKPIVLWGELSEWSDFPATVPDYVDEEPDDGHVADDWPAFQRLLNIIVHEALGRHAASVEFSPRRKNVVVQCIFDGGQDEAGALPCGAYESFVRYLQHAADGDGLAVTVGSRRISLRMDVYKTEYGTQTVLHLAEMQGELQPPTI